MSQCPKCKSLLRTIAEPSLSSSLDDGESNLIHGKTCWCCGKWIDIVEPPVKPMPAKEFVPGSQNFIRKSYLSQLDRIVWQHKEAVDGMVKKKRDLADIASFLVRQNPGSGINHAKVRATLGRLENGRLARAIAQDN